MSFLLYWWPVLWFPAAAAWFILRDDSPPDDALTPIVHGDFWKSGPSIRGHFIQFDGLTTNGCQLVDVDLTGVREGDVLLADAAGVFRPTPKFT